MKVSEIASWLGLPVEGDGGLNILQAAPLDTAGPADIAFALPRKAGREAAASHAGCLIVPEDFDNAEVRTVIRASDPRAAFARVVARLHPPSPASIQLRWSRRRPRSGRMSRSDPSPSFRKKPRSATGRPSARIVSSEPARASARTRRCMPA
jgi:hypothetical protein